MGRAKTEAVVSYPGFRRRLHEGLFIMLSAFTLFLMLALISYHPSDSAWSSVASGDEIANLGGRVGAWFADIFYYLFGLMAYLFPAMIALCAYAAHCGRVYAVHWSPAWMLLRGLGFVLTLLCACALCTLHWGGQSEYFVIGPGGLLGHLIAHAMVTQFGYVGATLALSAVLLSGSTLATGWSWFGFVRKVGQGFWEAGSRLAALWDAGMKGLAARRVRRREGVASQSPIEPKLDVPGKRERTSTIEVLQSKVNTPSKPVKKKPLKVTKIPGLPSLALLDSPEHDATTLISRAELETLAREVEAKLLDFNIVATVVGVRPGPVVTRLELELAPGVKASKVSGLAKDLARSLAVIRVRVVEVIPGKPYVGLEIPNQHREIVRLSEVLSTEGYQQSDRPLSMCLGKDISGAPVVVDLAKMPHLLVAGTTGSGKSVGVNAMILSMLYKAKPDEVRFIMIDPKMLELSVYDGIPHLLSPVVTDMKEAAQALTWCVAEMERRYRLMASLGVRNIAGYNRKVREASEAGEPLVDPLWQPGLLPSEDEGAPPLQTLPYIVVVVDEFADMIMVVGKKVEELIARIAQKARAAGIHLLLATQRPSVDVITGLIKANIPSRIAFQVSSRVDSRTILDQQGAEQLLGQGDMLYLPPGSGIPVRVHGAFVADREVHAVVKEWRSQAEPDYDDAVLQGASVPGLPSLGLDCEERGGESDQLYDEVVAFVTESRKASVSSVQRRFKVGYNRAARLVEELEASGVVSTPGHNGGREVLAPPPVQD